ncbi:caspase family protein [Phreatobacter stygius]|uniref:Peptidase C14 caspase domain-containing protein n=1 Tax=Phreatobacter stygius TaxID=1940610 RepID=A0A4D7AVV9_9HYPH|nr:caspase family protein [Phreatobacter stygius]QCI63971.1 hypothetical protein E8M01_06740 [Phreatobacter stygius]
MLGARILQLACVLFVFLYGPGPGQAQQIEKRIALVIGNSAERAGPIATAANDAGLIEQALRAAGFDVIGARDLDAGALRSTFREFLDKARSSGPDTIAFVYFAGLGLQLEGENYLVQVNARIVDVSDVPLQAVRLTDITGPLAAIPLKARIVVLDAARANSFALSGRRLVEGLAAIRSAAGTLIAFNATPGTVGVESGAAYGLYAVALSDVIKVSGVSLDALFAQVRERVNESAKGAQLPWNTLFSGPPVMLFQRPAAAAVPGRTGPSRAPAAQPRSERSLRQRAIELEAAQRAAEQIADERAEAAERSAREWAEAAEQAARERAEAAEQAAEQAVQAERRSARERAQAAEHAARERMQAAERAARERARQAAEQAARERGQTAEQTATQRAQQAAEQAARERAETAEQAARQRAQQAAEQAARERAETAEQAARRRVQAAEQAAQQRAQAAEQAARERVQQAEQAARQRAREAAEQRTREAAEQRTREAAEQRARETQQRAREAAEQRAREAEQRAREAAQQRAREAAEQRARDAEQRSREAAQQRAREAEQRARDAAEQRAREAEQRAREAEQRAREAAERQRR